MLDYEELDIEDDLFENFGEETWQQADKEEQNTLDDTWYESYFPEKKLPDRRDFQTALSRQKKNPYEIDYLLNNWR